MAKTLIVTGAAGFIGKTVAQQAQQRGFQVIGVDCVAPPSGSLFHHYLQTELPSPKLSELIRSSQPTALVHCAGMASVPLSFEDPERDFRSNVLATFEALSALRLHARDCRFILISSAAVYGNPAKLPIAENATIAPISPYGFHKRQAEEIVEEHAKLYNITANSVRVFSAFGAGLKRQVLWDICQKALTQKVVRLGGTGRESRDFIHVDDLATGIFCLLDQDPKHLKVGEAYNLSTGVETTIAALAQKLVATINGAAKIEFSGEESLGMPLNWRADISRLSALGFKPRVTIDDGLRGYAEWAKLESAKR